MTMPNVLANGPGNVPDAEELMENFDYLEGKVDDNLTDVDARLDAHDVAFMGKNLVINGSFSVNQRGLTTAADDVYHLDRWYVLTETGSVTIAQQTNQESGQPTNIRLTQPDATAKRIGIAQIVESINCRHLRGQAVTLSAKVRCSISQPINIAIVEWAGTADSVTSDIIQDWTKGDYDTPGQFFVSSITYNPPQAAVTPSAATWTHVTVSGTLGASVNNLIVFVWTAGTLAQSATLDIGKVQLEAGSSQTAFERRSHGIELELCSRYFQKVGNGSSGGWYSASAAQIGLRFETRMRVAPTLSLNTTTPTISEPGIATRTGSSSTLASLAGTTTTCGASVNIDGFSGATANRPAIIVSSDPINAVSEL